MHLFFAQLVALAVGTGLGRWLGGSHQTMLVSAFFAQIVTASLVLFYRRGFLGAALGLGLAFLFQTLCIYLPNLSSPLRIDAAHGLALLVTLLIGFCWLEFLAGVKSPDLTSQSLLEFQRNALYQLVGGLASGSVASFV